MCDPMGQTPHQNGQVSRPRSQDGGKEKTTEQQMQQVAMAEPPTTSRTAMADESPNASSEITHLYFTFETPLPRPNITTPTSKATSPSQPPPPQPDLTPYLNPLLFPRHRKNITLLLSCTATFLTAYTAGSYSPPVPLMTSDLHAPSDLTVRIGITTFCIGFALAPMILAPFSEINGRYPVFVVSGVVYVAFQIMCGAVKNLAGMLVARFLVGVGSSVFSTMVGGVIADLWPREERNTPMAIFSGAVLAGTGAGPLVGSVMTYVWGHGEGGHGVRAAWRWVFWHQVIASAVLVVALALLFKESRGSVVLSRKARALNKWYAELEEAGYYGMWVEGGVSGRVATVERDAERPVSEREREREAVIVAAAQSGSDEERDVGEKNPSPPTGSRRQSEESSLAVTNSSAGPRLLRIRWVVKEDEQRSSLGKMIAISLYRPFHLLSTEPVVFFFSLWVAFAWGVLYLTFGAIPLVFKRQYGWNTEQAGWVFFALIVGAVLATIVGLWQERILHHREWQADYYLPEHQRSQSRFWAFMRRHFPSESPESRLYFTCVVAALLPAGLFMFGFTARPDTHWIAPTIAICLATIGIYSIYLAVFNYFADTYHKYASSAMAAQSFCRNMLGGVFPLVTVALYTNLGEAKAGAILGGVASGLTAVPFILIFFGEKIRARSPFASELMKT